MTIREMSKLNIFQFMWKVQAPNILPQLAEAAPYLLTFLMIPLLPIIMPINAYRRIKYYQNYVQEEDERNARRARLNVLTGDKE